MKIGLPCSTSILFMALAASASVESAQPPGQDAAKQGRVATAAATSAAKASPKERAQLTHQFVTKWGAYVQRVYDVPVSVWAQRMAPNFKQADATNFRDALKRDTFEGAMAQLAGTGHRISDDQVINQYATAGKGDGTPNFTIMSLGALTNDLVYTPVAPCRIVDTRNTGAGAIAAGTTRNFVAFGASSFSGQGGSATNCGVNPLAATAVAINLTAIFPSAPGYATAYPYNTPQPLAASINYTAGAIVNNALIVQTPNPIAAFDFTIFTVAQSHYAADIVGYFAPPVATALQCQDTANTTVSGIVSGGTANAVAPACPAGYTQTATNCEASSWLVPFVYFHAGTCSARNNDSTSQEIRASRTCCRIPGR